MSRCTCGAEGMPPGAHEHFCGRPEPDEGMPIGHGMTPHAPAHRGGVSATDCELVTATDCELVTATEFRRMEADRAALLRLDVVLRAIERLGEYDGMIARDVRVAVDPDGTILRATR